MLGMLMMLPIVLSVVSAQPPNEPPVFIFALFALTFAAFMILMFAAQVLIVPLVLRAGLAQDFVSAFSIQFFRDFFGRVWPEALLSMLFFLVTAPVVILAGFLVCFVGVYAAGAVLMFAQYHFHYQLYELYLSRGGTPIPLKQE
jgi:hypothetical protein